MPLRIVLTEGETRTVRLHGEPVRVRCRKVGRCRIEVVLDDRPAESPLETGRDRDETDCECDECG